VVTYLSSIVEDFDSLSAETVEKLRYPPAKISRAEG